MMGTNLTGAFLAIKHAGAAIAASGGGSIVAISSIAGPLTHPYMAPYCVSKAGLETLVRNAADELGRAGVRVNAIRPGLVRTELADPLAVRRRRCSPTTSPRCRSAGSGTVDDVGAAVRFLCGPESTWITGQVLGVDGGHTLRRGPNIEHWARPSTATTPSIGPSRRRRGLDPSGGLGNFVHSVATTDAPSARHEPPKCIETYRRNLSPSDSVAS